ncbi:hypothetical protein M513_08564 [Trichuris suis]|uniref:NR LBD domain-containing protein n=1 Tax=Trichuris suis TaxID=68888 RepID=A0A085M069_9BILA|nr:hypothetical protein M513_08564 [Trichuris suis]
MMLLVMMLVPIIIVEHILFPRSKDIIHVEYYAHNQAYGYQKSHSVVKPIVRVQLPYRSLVGFLKSPTDHVANKSISTRDKTQPDRAYTNRGFFPPAIEQFFDVVDLFFELQELSTILPKETYEVQIKRMQQVSKVCSQTYSPLDKRQLVYGFVKAEASELHFLNKRQILWLNVLNGRNDLKYLLLPVLLLQNFPVASKVVVNGRRSTFLRILNYLECVQVLSWLVLVRSSAASRVNFKSFQMRSEHFGKCRSFRICRLRRFANGL